MTFIPSPGNFECHKEASCDFGDGDLAAPPTGEVWPYFENIVRSNPDQRLAALLAQHLERVKQG